MSKEQAWSAIGDAFAVADGENTSLLAIFNGADSPWRLEVDRILAMSASLVAVAGVNLEIRIRRLSGLVVGGGAAAGLIPLNSASLGEDMKAHVTAFVGGTETLKDIIAYRLLNNDENPLTGQSYDPERFLWSPADKDHPLVLNKSEGVGIFQVTASTVGGFIPQIDFRGTRQ